MGGEEADKFFSMEDLNADYDRKYRRTKLLNGNKENVVVDSAIVDHCALSSSSIRSTTTGSMANVHTLSPKMNLSPLFTPAIFSTRSQNKTPTSMLMESTPNIVRLVGKRTKLGDLPSIPIVTPRSNSRENYMNPPEDEIVTDDEEESNDFNEGLNVVAPSLWSDDSDGSEYEASCCESSDDADCLSGSHDVDDEDTVNEMNSKCNLMQSRRTPRRVIPEEYASLGAPTAICSKCHARMWKEEKDRQSVDKEVVRGLITMLDETNQLVGKFRQQRDLYESDEILELQITLKVIRSKSGRECHISSTDEVVGIMIGDTEETCGDRDIVFNEKGLTPRLGERLFQQYMKMMECAPGCIAPNYPDIISRVFRLKLDKLMGDIKDKKHFGVCIGGGLPPQIRQLFVHIIFNCKVTDLKTLWSTHWKSMVDDILLKRRKSCPNTLFTLNDTQLQFYALGEKGELLRSVGKSLKKFDQLPQPPRSYLKNGTHNLIIEETSYDTGKMDNVGGIFFIYGSGGCGKTFLWRTLICKLRAEGEIVLPVASSGIAAILMPGG
ncbi:hypothetical protein AgCh_010212 [Apium graveolens]